MNPFYTDYSEYLDRFFPGRKVQKISVNLGGSCPNRDGTLGTGGCIYCDNSSFTPSYCFGGKSVKQQIEEGKRFFARKYPKMEYLAYFQSYTSTFGKGAEEFGKIIAEAATTEGVAGIIVGTRPDCISDEMARMLAETNREHPVFVELGTESMHDNTLAAINRGHDTATTCRTVEQLAALGLHVGLHLIAGLPGETLDDALESLSIACRLPIESVKLHHLQVLRGTRLEQLLKDKKIEIKEFGINDYLDFCVKAIGIVPKGIAIERFLASAPPQKVVSPKWGLKNHEFVDMLINKLKTKSNNHE